MTLPPKEQQRNERRDKKRITKMVVDGSSVKKLVEIIRRKGKK